MTRKERQMNAMKESLVTVGSGLVINWPISLALLYIFIDILELSTFMVSILVTGCFTFIAVIRVYLIRMFFTKPAEENEHDTLAPVVSVPDEDHEIDRMLRSGDHHIGYEKKARVEDARLEKERKEHLLTLHPFLMYEDATEEKPKDGRWKWYGEGSEDD